MSSESPRQFSDGQLANIASELREIAHGSSWSRTLATGELVLKHFFAGNVEEWRTHRREKEASIRRLAQRPDCPLGKSALSEAVAIYVAREGLPKCVDELTPSHVAIALRVPPVQRLGLIEQAVVGAWSVREMRSEALLLRRRAGDRRGRPRFSQARCALSQLKTSLDALESSIELLGETVEVDAGTVGLIDRALSRIEQRLGDARARVEALASRPGLRSALRASVVVPANGRIAG